MYDPFKGLTPSFGPFAAVFESEFGILLAAIWAGAFVYVAYHLIVAVAGIAAARRHGRVDVEVKAGAVMWPLVAVIALVAIPAVWAAL